MNQKETDFLNFENELLNTRKKLNDLIYKCSNEYSDSENRSLYQEKIFYLETELTYLNKQFQILKNKEFNAPKQWTVAAKTPDMPTNIPTTKPDMPQTVQPETSVHQHIGGQPINIQLLQQTDKGSIQKDYEKIFGKSFMGIFASVLIFISLIIFATLLLPYLTNTMKLIGLYIISLGLITAGFVLIKRNTNNKFYIALIGCGAGSLYITLLLSDLYFKVFGDILLYVFILVWAVFVKYLTKMQSLIFQIIGQIGIFISSILGVLLCVHDTDAQKLLMLTIFYFISAFVFDVRDKRSGNAASTENNSNGHITYEQNLCSHIFKSLNLIIFMLGFIFMNHTMLKTVNILLIMVYILFEFYFSFREKCTNGLAFQILTIVNTIIFISLFNIMELLAGEHSFAFMYIVSAAVLFYVNLKDAEYKIFSQLCCFVLIHLGCYNNPIISKHLFAYFSVIPFMLYGNWKKNTLYMYTSLTYIVALIFLIMSPSSNYFLKIEYMIMIIAIYAVFLYICKTTKLTAFKVIGYLILCLLTITGIADTAHSLLHRFASMLSMEIKFIDTKTILITFFTLAIIHLILNKLEYFGKEKPIEIMMLGINGLLMTTGCYAFYEEVWKLPVILLTILLFMLNSKRILQKNIHSGYYVMFKYTVLMFCILDSYNVINYAISICLLLFAIISIVSGFYKSNKSFRMYGLLLSMVSIFKLIMVDIQYDSKMENAVSFFISGILCFIISFIYNRIDHNFQNKQ